MSREEEFSFWERVQLGAIGLIGWMLVWCVNLTVRFQTEDEESLLSQKRLGRPVIYSFWHNQIFLATYYFRFQGIVVITSRHFDGEYIAKIIRRFGYGAARGSSTRGAVGALLELKQSIQKGRDVAFTVDGPRGPRYKVKSGPLFLARKTGACILPFHIEPKVFWQLNGWDGFRIPRPFTTALVKFGRLIPISPDQEAAEEVAAYQAEMDRIQGYCEAWRLRQTRAEIGREVTREG